MKEPKLMYVDISNDVAVAEDALAAARGEMPMDAQNSFSLLSIAASQLAIAKMMMKGQT